MALPLSSCLIGVISDTHDRLDSVERALAFFAREEVSLVVHCGDWKSLGALHYFADKAAGYHLSVRGVLGNNDADPAAFRSLAASAPGDFALYENVYEFIVGDARFAVYHGHHAPTLRRVRASPTYDIVLLGHTHKPKIEEVSGRLIVNPGSTAFAIPRSKEWQPTVALVNPQDRVATLHFL